MGGQNKVPTAPSGLRACSEREVRVGVLLPLVDALASRGLPLAEMLVEVGAPHDLFADPENRVDDVTICRLFLIAAQRLSQPHLGLLVGRRRRLADLGAVGELVSHCPTVGTGLRALISHLSLSDRVAAPMLLDLGPQHLILGYSFYHRIEVPIRPALDVAISVAFAFLEQMCGPALRPLEVRFAYDEPDDLLPYREAFGCPVRFNAELSGVVFPADLLDLPLADADPRRRAVLEAQIREARAHAGMSFAQQVHAVLPQAILGGRCTQAEVAQIFAMHERSLRRHLLAEGAHFHALLARARRELATQLLADTRLSVAGIARALGYADPNVFSRAFRAWTGTSPSAWRASLADPTAAAPDAVGP